MVHTKMELMSWQQEMLKKMSGFKKGELMVMAAGRQTGKSTYMKHWHDIFNSQTQELELSEGTVFGARYYTIEPKGYFWPELETWAKSTYGEPASIWERDNFIWPDCGRWYMNNSKFWFRNERDRTMFILRWSR